MTIRTDLQSYAHKFDFRQANAEYVAGWRKWNPDFACTFAKVSDGDLLAAIKANLPALTKDFLVWDQYRRNAGMA